MQLTKKAKRYLRKNGKLKVYVELSSAEVAEPVVTRSRAVAK